MNYGAKKIFNARLPNVMVLQETKDRLAALGRHRKTSLAKIVRDAIDEYLSKDENQISNEQE